MVRVQPISSAVMVPSSTPAATRLLAWTASGALTVIRSASASAASTTVPSGTTSLIRPQRSASAAVMGSPVTSSRMATFRGNCSTMRNTPPAAAIRPRLTSGRPNWALSTATARSLARVSSVPPPNAAPLTAAMVGLSMKWLT